MSYKEIDILIAEIGSTTTLVNAFNIFDDDVGPIGTRGSSELQFWMEM